MNTVNESLQPIAARFDELIAEGLRSLESGRRWSEYELRASLDDLLKLSAGEDACYDRPSSGWAYAAWYHGRRTHAVLRALLGTLPGRAGTLTIVDLGSGTGATAWALVALKALERHLRHRLPKIKVVAVDSSQPMMEAGRCLWEQLKRDRALGPIARELDPTWHLACWTELGSLDLPDADAGMVVGSYLLDDSDRTRAEAVGSLLAASADAIDASQLLLISSTRKREMTAGAVKTLRASAWTGGAARVAASMVQGDLEAVATVRSRVYGAVPGLARFAVAPTWDSERELPVVHHYQREPDQVLFRPRSDRGFALDAAQHEIATPREGLTAIVGAAGSGKSRILIERAVRTSERPRRDHSPTEMLITTFNNGMVEQLAAWLKERLADSTLRRWRCEEDRGDFFFHDPERPDESFIRLMTWDKIGTRVFAISPGTIRDLRRRDIEQRLADVQVNPDKLTAEQRAVLHPEFLRAEQHRFIYGRRVWHDKGSYRTELRTGAGSRLSAQQRDLIWDVLAGDSVTWAKHRMRVLTEARGRADRGVRPPFTHLMIDECQDMTPADYELATLLVADPNNIVAAGDEAQSLHLGYAYQRPGQVTIPHPYRTADQPGHRRWTEHRLTGSYRLPLRVCECVEPIASRIRKNRETRGGPHDVALPDAKKPAVLGIRPIIIANKQEDLSLKRIHQVYGELLRRAGDRRITVAEERDGSAALLKAPNSYDVELRSMRQIKGLERPWILWRTAIRLPAQESELEWIYTILTRTTALAVISIDPDATPEANRAALRLLRRDRLLIWDQDAEEALARALEPSSL